VSRLFRHGVASGDPLDDRVVIWTRLTTDDQEIGLDWVVAGDPELDEVIASGRSACTADSDHTLKVDVSGLEPDRRYWYAFEAPGERSPVGRTRTLPGAGCERITFVESSCARFNSGFFNAYARMAERDEVNFWLHLGDYIYEFPRLPPSQIPGPDLGRPFDPENECVRIDDYRRRYAQYRSDPDVQALHLAHPLISTVDDHDLADGAWRGGAIEHKPDRDGPWEDRLKAAFRARSEWIPVRLPDETDPTRVFRSVRIGDLAELFLIDTRSRRDEPQDGPAMSEPGRSQLGEEQREWLLEALRGSDATHRLICNGSVMTQIWDGTIPEEAELAVKALKLTNPGVTGPDPDQWDGYPVERDAILSAIGALPERNVVVLSGDVHIGMANELRRGRNQQAVAIEFVTASLTSQNADDKLCWKARTKSIDAEEALQAAQPWMKFLDFDSHGYMKVDVNPHRVRSEWWFCATILERSEGQRCGAAFEVEAGSAALTPVELAQAKSAC
jgi:alkaline phosphatase D